MTKVLAGKSLGSTATQWQDGLCSFQRQALAFVIQAKHHRILRRTHVQAYHITHFAHKLPVGGKLKVLMAVRLQSEGLSNPGDAVVREPQGKAFPQKTKAVQSTFTASHVVLSPAPAMNRTKFEDLRHLFISHLFRATPLRSH